MPRKTKAIKKSDHKKAWAKRLHDKHSDLQYAEKNPYTSVYQLVDELNQYLI